MIAQVLRFDRAYRYLKDTVDSGTLGKLDNIYMDRHSVYPTWGASFADNSITGGCTLDTHIHDVDVARFLLGEPCSVSAVEFNRPPNLQVVTSTLRFGSAVAVISCSWDSAYEKSFTFGYRARFEGGSVVCEDGAVTLIPNGGEPVAVTLPDSDGVTEELRHFLSVVINGAENTVNPPESSMESVRLIEIIRESAASGKVVSLR